MIIKINNKELYINSKMYHAASKIAEFILKTMRTKTRSNNQNTFYYAIIIALHTLTGETLSSIDDDELDILMRAWDDNNKELVKTEEVAIEGE